MTRRGIPMPILKLSLSACLVAFVGGGCRKSTPEVHHYSLALPKAPAAAARGETVIVVEPFSTDAGYDDVQIVYRSGPVKLDYYHYHRWTAPPGVIVADFLARALQDSGRFRDVVRGSTSRAVAVLSGRIVAFEEVDRSADRWVGHVSVELRLRDNRTGELLWSRTYREEELLAEQSPEGLALALSRALGRIATAAATEVAEVSETAGRAASAAPAPPPTPAAP